MTDPLGQSQVLPYLKGLSKLGYDFHLISYEKSDRYKQHKRHIQSICDEDNIKWHPQYYAKNKGLKATLKQVRKLRKVAFYLNEKHHFDIVHCRSYISALAGLKMKQKFNSKFVFDMRGFWADERVDGGLWNLENKLFKTIYSFFKRKEKQFIANADYTISLTRNGKKEIESWETTPQNTKIKVIPCCANLDLFDVRTIKNEDLIEAKNTINVTEDQFILGYVGSIGTWYMLPEMLDFFIELQKSKPNAIFLFVTGEPKENIEKEANSKGIRSEAIRVISVLHKDVPKMIALMNASVFFIRPTYSKKASSPTKQGEIMAMGVPLICNSDVGDTDEIVNKYHSGVVVNEFSVKSYQAALNQLGEFDANAIIQGANDYFSLSEGVKKYASVYSEILE